MRTSLTRLRRWLLTCFVQSLGIRRQRIMAWELMRRTGVDPVCFRRGGLSWTVQLSDYDPIERNLFVDGGFQVAEIEALLEWARHFGVFAGSRNVLIDVGANVGTTCIPMVHSAGCRALAIEPVAATFSQLRQNVESNAFIDRILLANKAVAMQPGRIRMCLAKTSGGHAVSSRLTGDPDGAEEIPLAVGAITGYEDVEADTLSGIVAAAGLDAGEIALVWSDVQGCELAVIESGSEFWARSIPLWAEVEPISLRRQGTLDRFPDALAAHFDRFIPSTELCRLGLAAVPRPIAEFPHLIAGIAPGEMSTDVLLLPPAFSGYA